MKSIMEDIRPGETVIYVPRYVQEQDMSRFDFRHPKCEYGLIKSANDKFIFVNYVINGIPQSTAKATNPQDLFRLNGECLFNVLETFKHINEGN